MGPLLKHINTPLALKKNETNDEGIGRSRGGLTSKIHCMVDGLGNPVKFILTGGEVNDSVCAEDLLDGTNSDYVLGDKAFDTDKILDKISQMGAVAVIPPKSNRIVQREYDKHIYKDRNLVERFFCKLKQFRGIATRYCKRGKHFLEAVKLVSSIILMC